MANNPWFKFWASDFLTDDKVDSIAPEAEGLLVRMWCVCSLRGSIPSSIEEIARLTSRKTHYVSQYVSQCVSFFEERDGKLYSRRMEREKHKSDKARESAQHRWESTTSENDDAKRNAIGIAKRNAQKSESQRSEDQKQEGEAFFEEPPVFKSPLPYAQKVLEDLEIPVTRRNSEAVAAAIKARARGEPTAFPAAVMYLTAAAMDAKEQGERVTAFWFEDGKYERTNGRKKSGLDFDCTPEV